MMDAFIPVNLSFFGGGGGGGVFPNTQGGKQSSSNRNWRLKGNPGDIIKDGSTETRIGDDGRAISERHYSDHGNSKSHSNPHDHKIDWDADGNPIFSRPINYPDGNVPDFE